MEPVWYFLGFNICFLAALMLSDRFLSRITGKHALRRLLLVISLVFLFTMAIPQTAVATIIIEKSLPTDPVRSPFGIAAAKNSSFVVFAEKHAGKIGFFGTGQCWLGGSFNGSFREFPLPGVDGSTAEPRDVALGNRTLRSGVAGDVSEGFVYFTEFVRNRIGKLELVVSPPFGPGRISEFTIPTANSGPMNLAIDPYNGSVWFTEYQANKIGRLFWVAAQEWRFIEYSLPTPNSYPVDIAVDPNCWTTGYRPWSPNYDKQTYVWFTMSGCDKIGRLNGETGEIVEYSTRGTPWGITVTSQSFVWFTQKLGDRLAHLNPWTGMITEVPLPVHSPGNEPLYIANDTDGSLWFTESATNIVGRYLPGTNVFQEFVVPTAASKPHGIAVTPRLWGTGVQTSPINHYGTFSVFFTEEVGNKIGKIIVPSGPWTTTLTVGFVSSASTTTSSATTLTTAATSTTTSSTATRAITTITASTPAYANATITLTDTVTILQTSTTSTWTKTTTSTSITTTTSTSTSVTTTTSTTLTTTTVTSTSTTTSSSTTSSTTTTSTTYTSTSYSPTITTSTTFSTMSTYLTTTTTTTTPIVSLTSQVLVVTTTTTTAIVTTTPAARACIIASVAYGSELAPEVQFLRGFRDSAVMSTFAGAQFMRIFNNFYYSFSPKVAELAAGYPILQAIVRTLIYPLLASLRFAAVVSQIYPQASQLMITVAGVLASGMVGVLYLSPVVILLKAFRRKMNALGGV